MVQKEFIKAGFSVEGTDDNENKLLSFLKENYPNVIRDNEINIAELKTVLGLPIEEKGFIKLIYAHKNNEYFLNKN